MLAATCRQSNWRYTGCRLACFGDPGSEKCAEPCEGYILNYNYVKNILGVVVNATGVCADFEYTSGERPFDKCNATGEGIDACLTSEIYARGEASRYYMKYLYNIFVEQNNFKECKFDY